MAVSSSGKVGELLRFVSVCLGHDANSSVVGIAFRSTWTKWALQTTSFEKNLMLGSVNTSGHAPQSTSFRLRWWPWRRRGDGQLGFIGWGSCCRRIKRPDWIDSLQNCDHSRFQEGMAMHGYQPASAEGQARKPLRGEVVLRIPRLMGKKHWDRGNFCRSNICKLLPRV